VSSPDLDLDEVSEVLARKAKGDAKAVRLLAANPEIADDIVGYEDLLDAEPSDRDATIALVEEVGRWAEDAIEGTKR
jgi:hypothetical protein